MSYLYKLGDGPLNYDWNHRYAWIEGSEIFYSPSLDERDRKTLNIYGSAVTNICKIKNKSFAFGIILNPPITKVIYFAFDDLYEAEIFREKIIKATSNTIYDDTLINCEENDEKCNQIQIEKTKNNNEKLFNIGFNIKRKKNSEEFYENLEKLRKKYIVDDNKTIKKFARGIKISVPFELDFYNFLQNVFCKFFLIFIFF